MLIAYFVFSAVVSLFMSFIWSSNGGTNCLIKTAFAVWFLWSAGMLAVTLFPTIAVAMPR